MFQFQLMAVNLQPINTHIGDMFIIYFACVVLDVLQLINIKFFLEIALVHLVRN